MVFLKAQLGFSPGGHAGPISAHVGISGRWGREEPVK